MLNPSAIAKALGSSPSGHPIPVSGGCIHHCYRWGGYFIKTNTAAHAGNFRAEATGLKKIAASNSIRVPEFITHYVSEDNSFLILEHLDLFPSGNETLLGEQLAELHGHTADQFGFSENNFIGSTPQSNTWTDDWPRFFRDQRISPLIIQLKKKGISFPGSQRLLDRLPELLPENPRPSLIHGDLWSGNKSFLKDGTPVIFDPACYHGHAACDLAMTTLFGGFGPRFYDAYRSSSELDAPSLHELYNLYHVLNHALLFGGNYVAQAGSIIRRYS